MADSIKLRAQVKNGVTTIKALITHPMETGMRKDKKTNEVIPAHFIQTVVCKHNEKEVLSAEWGGSVSQNPYLSFNFEGGKDGDNVELTWVDNKGGTDTATAQIKP